MHSCSRLRARSAVNKRQWKGSERSRKDSEKAVEGLHFPTWTMRVLPEPAPSGAGGGGAAAAGGRGAGAGAGRGGAGGARGAGGGAGGGGRRSRRSRRSRSRSRRSRRSTGRSTRSRRSRKRKRRSRRRTMRALPESAPTPPRQSGQTWPNVGIGNLLRAPVALGRRLNRDEERESAD